MVTEKIISFRERRNRETLLMKLIALLRKAENYNSVFQEEMDI